jgi:hypothetical protein
VCAVNQINNLITVFPGTSRKGKTRLAIEAQRCIDSDPMYGPVHDKRRHCIGIQYEVMLEEYLKEMGEYRNV